MQWSPAATAGWGSASFRPLSPLGRASQSSRHGARLDELRRLDVPVWPGDATDPGVMDAVVAHVEPRLLILNAGATPTMAPLVEQTWDTFSATWNVDVKAGLHGIQAAFRAPLAQGSRVLIASSGAAISGSPLSGGYAGAKRMLWLMAQYATRVAEDRGLGIRFQALVPLQMFGETQLGHRAASAYAQEQGISVEAFLAAQSANPLSPRQYGDHVATLLTDPRFSAGVAYGLNSRAGIVDLDGAPR